MQIILYITNLMNIGYIQFALTMYMHCERLICAHHCGKLQWRACQNLLVAHISHFIMLKSSSWRYVTEGELAKENSPGDNMTQQEEIDVS